MKNFTYSIFNRTLQNNEIEDISEYICALHIVRHLSLFNGLLIYSQRPGASCYVYTESYWEKYGRFVKVNATPIVIISPGRPVDFLFEYIDTEGDDTKVPDYIKTGIPMIHENKVTDEIYDKIKANVYLFGAEVEECEFGERQGGLTEKLEKTKYKYVYKKKLDKHLNKYVYENIPYPINYRININEKFNPQVKFSVLMHELGHILCKHLLQPNDKERRPPMSRNSKEVEAEMVAKFVCDSYKIENECDKYIKDHSDDSADKDLDVIVNVADKIINDLKLDKCFH